MVTCKRSFAIIIFIIRIIINGFLWIVSLLPSTFHCEYISPVYQKESLCQVGHLQGSGRAVELLLFLCWSGSVFEMLDRQIRSQSLGHISEFSLSGFWNNKTWRCHTWVSNKMRAAQLNFNSVNSEDYLCSKCLTDRSCLSVVFTLSEESRAFDTVKLAGATLEY